MYLLNQSVHSERTPGRQPDRNERNPRAGDRLYRNDGGHFTDVSAQSGISAARNSYGLTAIAGDSGSICSGVM